MEGVEAETGNLAIDVAKGLHLLCKRNLLCSAKLHLFLAKQIWTPVDRKDVLDLLAELFLLFSCTEDICWCFRSLILDIIVRTHQYVLSIQDDQTTHQRFCIALSKAIPICPHLKGFALEYIGTGGAFLGDCELNEPEKKKRKRDKKNKKCWELEMCQAAWRFARCARHAGKEVVPFDSILPFLCHRNKDVRWFAMLAVAELLVFSPSQRESLHRKLFDPGDVRDLVIRHNEMERRASTVTMSMDTLCESQSSGQELKYTMKTIVTGDLSDGVVAICGVLLPALSPSKSMDDAPDTGMEGVVLVPSTRRYLHSLALAVSSAQPVLLQGAVGSGKTSLVEHLARLTGRPQPPHFMKIQLGDQTDSKALLGTYRCTDVPGEFVWQPGPLTQAVSGGHWVLLEDIDYAPMDVVSVLLPLLESGILSLPGHGDNIHAAPGFRIFVTQRLLSGVGGWYSQHGSNSVLLEKLWTKINVEPLSRQELQQVIIAKYPQLTSVVERLLDIYAMLSAGKLEVSSDYMDTEDFDTSGNSMFHDGRLICTRDLMTWCRRIAVNFDPSSPESSPRLFLEAMDCFCSYLSNPAKRLMLAYAIGAKLNVGKVKAEFYCSKYKPNVEISPSKFTVGRVSLPRLTQDQASLHRASRVSFAFTRQAAVLLDRVAVCVANNEPVLLVGETGTGKTASVQFLAQQLGHNLRVINMNQQSDSADLLGGFKPVDLRHVVGPFKEEFELLFCQTFSRKQNAKFLQHVQVCFTRRRWTDLFSLLEHTQQAYMKKCQSDSENCSKWLEMGTKLHKLKLQVRQTENTLAFAFIEGTLVRALRKGDWVLLDEINLASAETLECLSGLLESTSGSVVLTERGDTNAVTRNANFRLFACMNPATDVGKKDLPLGIRNRFTELYVNELVEVADLKVLTAEYLRGLSLSAAQVEGIVKFYLAIREEAVKTLTDGTGHKPHFSLRTLCRALRYAAKNPCVQVSRSLYEGFCLSFLTQLDRASHPVVEKLVCRYVLGGANTKALLKQDLPQPPGDKHVHIEGYWIPTGQREPHIPDNYILTPSVRANLRDLSRIVSAGQHPVLLQGETSVGKTSLVTWLAHATGNHCVRVNNHEHTDLQEYVGCYAANEAGKLVFKEGVLVEAMRKGHWIILDELNLAPSDVLEALNRLLDDNRELFIPETQETVRAHHRFMLFATQNPPGQYGGRKILSRAFRNRFVELHFDEIPSTELETILHKRCALPMSYGRRLVAIMLELQVRRRGSGLFAGKQGFMTLRDLFRWANRYHCSDQLAKLRFYDWDQHMADHGYMLLAGRVRREEECGVVREVIQKHLKRTVDPRRLFTLSDVTSHTTAEMLKLLTCQTAPGFEHIVWTYSMRRLAVLVTQTLKYKEPVLLVGETGCGKTTVCQLMAALEKTRLHSLNCHMHSESADFLGGLRPVRDHSKEESESGAQRLFEWIDGPLVLAMKHGHMLLIDEISLADDSVLERLNSVLEPERSLLLAEKGGGGGGGGADSEVETVQGEDGFSVMATMNPGGDYGKKELSPALRNRFTEIWCEQVRSAVDLLSIIEHNLNSGLHLCNQEDGTSGIGRAMIQFVHWFSNNDLGKRCTISVRDFLSWVQFINTCGQTLHPDGSADLSDVKKLEPAVAYIHGACLVFLDGLGSGVTSGLDDGSSQQAYNTCLKYLVKQVNDVTGQHYSPDNLGLRGRDGTVEEGTVVISQDTISITPFSIPTGPKRYEQRDQYALMAPTPCMNAQRILRALQLTRPILLEGSPGVGKTSLVSALAKAASRDLVRINLSEQTDVTDLFGADLPVEGEDGGVFAWRDGPLLRALKLGHWVILDELNLATQSVLEGLNACFDHRAEVFIPELGRTFQIQHENTRIFACQNPLNQGGGRKGLPKSFLNRFTQVYVEALTLSDLVSITSTMYPSIPEALIGNMVQFNQKLYETVMVHGQWGQRGAPWEFNLRDVFRWCDLLLHNQIDGDYEPGEFISLIYRDRMRTEVDKKMVMELYEAVCPESPAPYVPWGRFSITPHHIQVGQSYLARRWQHQPRANQNEGPLYMLHHCLAPLESLVKCVEMKWMAILVGPQSSGKTSLVKLLSELSGNTVQILAMNSAMDTTELLGGFEQSDLARHLEEVSGKVREMVRVYCVDTLLDSEVSSNIASLTQLYQHWHKYTTAVTQGETASTVKELKIMKDQQRQLSVILDLLEKLGVSSSSLTGCRDRLCGVETKLEGLTAKPGGGTFEWIDSLLVRALQSGHWLLIDNVNFCSASVLDRLNALLEPNGVLTVNERGVIDGQVPVIKPHPDFRLFLAMDPKFGEISRAMRNRGVEIYITGEGEGGHYDDQDIKTMLHGMGLMGKGIADWLIGLHSDMRGALIGGERPTVHDLLHVAVLTKQEMDRGVPLSKAMRSACSNVYIQNLKNVLSKQRATEILQGKCDSIQLEDLKTDSIQPGLHPVSMPNIQDYCQNATLANIVKQSAMISYALSELHQQFEGRSGMTDLKEGTVHTVQDTLAVLKYGTQIVIEGSSFNNWPLSLAWLEKLSNQTDKVKLKQWLQKTLPCPLGPETEVYGINHAEFVKNILGTIFSSPASRDCETVFKALTPVADRLLSGEHDPRWNPQSLKMVCREKCDHVGQESVRELMTDLEHTQNRLYLVQFIAEQKLLDESWLSSLPKKVKSPLGISFVYHQGSGGASTVEHPVLLHLYPLLTQVYEQMELLLLSPLQLSDQRLSQILERFGWFKRLIDFSRQTPAYGFNSVLPLLNLHWNWFYSKTFVFLQDDCQFQLSDKLQAVVSSIHSLLGQNSVRSEVFLKVWESYGHPRPLQCQREAEQYTAILNICSRLLTSLPDGVGHKAAGLLVPSAATVQTVVKMAALTLDLLHEHDDAHNSEIEEQIDKMESLMYDIVQPRVTEMGNVGPPAVKGDRSRGLKLRLQPLRDLLTVIAEKQCGTRLVQQMSDGTKVENLVEFMIQYNLASPVLVSLLNQLCNHCADETKWPLLITLLVEMNLRLWTGPLTHNPLEWLIVKEERSQESYNPANPLGRLHKGPGMLQLSPLTFISFHVLHSWRVEEGRVENSTTDLLPVDIGLGEFEESQAMFLEFQGLLWSHSSVMASPDFDIRALDRKKVLFLLIHLLESMTELLTPGEVVNEWNTCLRAMRTDCHRPAQQVLNRIREGIKTDLSVIFGDTITNVLLNCLEDVRELGSSGEVTLTRIGTAWVHLGLLQSLLLAPVGPVDPLVKQRFRLQYINTEITEIEAELVVRNRYEQLLTGQELDETRSDLLHPRVRQLFERRRQLAETFSTLEGQQAYRPDPPKFDSLLRDVSSYQQTTGEPQFILDLLANLHNVQSIALHSGHHIQDPVTPNCFQEEGAWQATQQRFLETIKAEYTMYRDLVEPFVLAVHQMKYGMKMVCQAAQVDHKRALWFARLPAEIQVPTLTWLEDMMQTLCKFPSICAKIPDQLTRVKRLCSEEFLHLVRFISQDEGADADVGLTSRGLVSKILLSALKFLQQYALLKSTLSADVLSTFSHLLGVFVSVWREQENSRLQKEDEEASLFRFRATSYGDGLVEEERDERDFRKSFPSFEQDFTDLIDKKSLDDGPDISTDQDQGAEAAADDLLEDGISEKEMVEVWNTHYTVFTCLTRSDWLAGKSLPDQHQDHIKPVLSCYQVAATLGKKAIDKMYYGLDKELIGSHLAVIAAIQHSTSVDKEGVLRIKQTHCYDIYHDPNVMETVKCRPVLDRFINRVRELQSEWPDHPALKQMCVIVERILSFPVTSPLMKFVTGLELLLNKAQDWESNAAKHVSLTAQLKEVSELIIQWRKLELSCWSSSLETVQVKCKQQACKWWFHLYQLIGSTVGQDQSSPQMEGSQNGSKKDILSTLKQFLESSPLGEFSARLEMIYSFHCQLIHTGPSEAQGWLLNHLWNLHQFYHQFLSAVQEEVNRLKLPIEKELKGFVKIARWNDINYWALKQATEKTHRTIHKHIKAFQTILARPVKSLLVEGREGSESSQDASPHDWPQDVQNHMEQIHHCCQTGRKKVPVFSTPHLEQLPLQSRLPSLISRMSKHCMNILNSSSYQHKVLTLDELTGEVIEASQELQALEVNKTVDKDKQKSEAKNINLRKRKALSDLFKCLAQIGLSYRKGLTLKTEETQEDCLNVSPVDISVLASQLTVHKGSEQGLSRLWRGCDQYYYRSVSRRAQLLTALQIPSQELGVGNIDRCRGFSEQMMHILMEKQTGVSKLSQEYSNLRRMCGILSQMGDQLSDKKGLPPQDNLRTWTTSLRDLLCQVLEGLQQFSTVLQCCPMSSSGTQSCMSPLPTSALPLVAYMKHGDDSWSEMLDTVTVGVRDARKILSEVCALDEKMLLFWCDLDKLADGYQMLGDFTPKLTALAKQFDDPATQTPSCLNETIYFLCSEISSKYNQFSDWKIALSSNFDQSDLLTEANMEATGQSKSEDSSVQIMNFGQSVEELVVAMLFAVQKLTKTSTKEADREPEIMETDSSGLQDNHLTAGLHSDLQQDLDSLQCSKVADMLENLFMKLRNLSNEQLMLSTKEQPSRVCTHLLASCTALVEQYTNLVEFYLLQTIASHRVTGKLLSVLLKLFTELAMKGFCFPAEMSGEMDGGGATQFEDIEGGGIGEGEGVKDVSDQIETEDQLQDAQKAGEEKKEEDVSEEPDIQSEDNAIEMSEDIEGKLHDMEPAEGEESDGNDGEEENKLDKQMGEVDEKDADKLDEEMWGSDEEEESPEDQSKEESGPGAGKQSESELVAKDDNQDRSEDGEKPTETEETKDQGEDEDHTPHNLDQPDEEDYDENKVDPYYNQKDGGEQEPETMDLPEDMNLDEEDGDDQTQDETEEPEQTEDLKDSEVEAGEPEGREPDGVDEAGREESKEDIDQEENPAPAEESESPTQDGNDEDIAMETDRREEEEGEGEKGLTPQDEPDDEMCQEDKPETEDKDIAQAGEQYGQTSHSMENTEQSDMAQDRAGQTENNQEESDGTGRSTSERVEGHEGQTSSKIMRGAASQEHKSTQKRKPGRSKSDRSLGSVDRKYKQLRTLDNTSEQEKEEQEETGTSDLYEHIKDSQTHSDVQTMDVATAEQEEEQPVPNKDMEESEPMEEGEEGDVKPEDTMEDTQEAETVKELKASKLKPKKTEKDMEKGISDEQKGRGADEAQQYTTSGDPILTLTAERGPESTIHTALEHLNLDVKDGELDVDRLRSELEDRLSEWRQPQTVPDHPDAMEAWYRYEALTSTLSQELCEQLRLVLQPTQATKLRGDYRTGKRLNMRKVIPYIASQFRKDKIWLRRTKPSKREYQILLAIDDSSSMMDNHSKQLAFESLAVIANALTLLESGQLAICSFGESVKVLHPFTEQFTNQTGAKILQQFSFEQKKTKIAQLLKETTGVMLDARSRRPGGLGQPETAQLLLVVSDGRGLFMEGMEVVRSAVRQARAANIFLVFVVIDNPLSKDSILDIKVPHFKGPGELPEIRSYMDHFPFPFYLILRDINSLPYTLSDALRQWFELVTAGDR